VYGLLMTRKHRCRLQSPKRANLSPTGLLLLLLLFIIIDYYCCYYQQGNWPVAWMVGWLRENW